MAPKKLTEDLERFASTEGDMIYILRYIAEGCFDQA